MPNKTIYVKESDLPLYEKISASGEDSVSAKFAEFLRFEESMRQPQKIQFTPMPEVATLRDQFAMAAMLSDSIQSAVIAACYLGQGRGYSGEFPGLETAVEEHYKTADAMMEARKR